MTLALGLSVGPSVCYHKQSESSQHNRVTPEKRCFCSVWVFHIYFKKRSSNKNKIKLNCSPLRISQRCVMQMLWLQRALLDTSPAQARAPTGFDSTVFSEHTGTNNWQQALSTNLQIATNWHCQEIHLDWNSKTATLESADQYLLLFWVSLAVTSLP